MKIAFFSTKSYDKEFFETYQDQQGIHFKYFSASLSKDTVALASGYDGVCVFVNDKLEEETLEQLAAVGVKLIVLRCAGFNNVNIEVAEKLKLQLKKLELIRLLSDQLLKKKRLGVDIYSRGMTGGIRSSTNSKYAVSLFELLKSYSTLS